MRSSGSGQRKGISGLSDDVDDMDGVRDYVLVHCDDGTVFMMKDGKKPIKIWEED